MKRLSLFIVAGLLIVSMFWAGPANVSPNNNHSLRLQPPPFIRTASAQATQDTGTNFLEEEAGLAAYANAGKTINLSDIRPLFRTIERETSDYIIGSVSTPDYDNAWDPHVYAHRNGWVVSYYLSNELAVKAVDWRHFDGTSALNTQIDRALTRVLAVVGITRPEIGYYHFHYPNATNVMLIAGYADAVAWDSFELQIPGEFAVYERAWLHAAFDTGSELQLDGVRLNSLDRCWGCWSGTKYDEIQLQQLAPEQLHTVRVSYGGGHAVSAVSLVYREASQ